MSDLNSNDQIDLKLKTLVKLSREKNDSKRAAVVFYLLIRKEVNKKGILLGFAPLISKKERTTFEYMTTINAHLERTFQFHIFTKEMIEKLQKYELLYLKGSTFVSFNSLKELITIYYELRQLDVPNMYRLPDEINEGGSSLALFSWNNKKKRAPFFRMQKTDQISQYLSLDLEQKVRLTQTKLNKGYDKKDFEQLLYLRKLNKEIKEGASSKILFKGKLKDNTLYQQEMNQVHGFFLIGLATLFIMMAVVLFIQDFMLPEITGLFTIISFTLFGSAILIILLYWKLFYREK